MQDPSLAPGKAQAVAETVAGFTLMGMPWWAQMLAEINLFVTTLTAICGAIIGLAGVYTLISRWAAQRGDRR